MPTGGFSRQESQYGPGQLDLPFTIRSRLVDGF